MYDGPGTARAARGKQTRPARGRSVRLKTMLVPVPDDERPSAARAAPPGPPADGGELLVQMQASGEAVQLFQAASDDLNLWIMEGVRTSPPIWGPHAHAAHQGPCVLRFTYWNAAPSRAQTSTAATLRTQRRRRSWVLRALTCCSRWARV